jgi:CRISPR type III-B/RAMP module-associated protein Cmr5
MSLERKIAGNARDLVEAQVEKDAKHENETAYRSLCESLPILLRTAGLAQTATFLRAKSDPNLKAKAAPNAKKDEHALVYRHLEGQLKELGLLSDKETLINKATDPELKMPQYRLLFELSMTVAYWHKRMAQALLRKKD